MKFAVFILIFLATLVTVLAGVKSWYGGYYYPYYGKGWPYQHYHSYYWPYYGKYPYYYYPYYW